MMSETVVLIPGFAYVHYSGIVVPKLSQVGSEFELRSKVINRGKHACIWLLINPLELKRPLQCMWGTVLCYGGIL